MVISRHFHRCCCILFQQNLILCTIGEQWLECVPLLQILCLSGAFMPLFTLYQFLAISHGRSDVNMWLNIGQIVIQMVVILLFFRQGITVMVIAYTIFNILWLGPWHSFANRVIGLRLSQVSRDVAPFLIIAAVVMLATHYVTLSITNLWLLLLTRIIVASVLYYVIMRLLNVAILKECMQFIRKKN